MVISLDEIIMREKLIGNVLDSYKKEGLEYEYVEPEEDVDPRLRLFFPEIYSEIGSYVMVYRKTAFFKQKKKAAKIYYCEEEMRMEVLDDFFENNYAENIKLFLGIY